LPSSVVIEKFWALVSAQHTYTQPVFNCIVRHVVIVI
jgi:hypothetical protein